MLLALALAAGAGAAPSSPVEAAPPAGDAVADAPPQAGAIPPEPAADLLARLEESRTRDAARKEIIALGPRAADLLVSWRHHAEWPIRWEIATISGNTKDPRMIPTLAALAVEDSSAHVRWRAIWAIAAQAEPERARAAQLLKASLASENDSVRWAAAAGLASMDVADGLAILHEGLAHPDAGRRWEALHALADVHDETTIGRLKPFVASPEARERQELALTLGAIGGAEAIALLAQLARDASASVRIRACRGLAEAGGTEAGVVLIGMLETEQDEAVRASAERAMRELARR